MKRSVYLLILYLIALPAGLLIGLQVATVSRQYELSRENFEADVKNALNEVYQVYASWNSHTSNEEDSASYNSLYVTSDSTFSVLIAQSAQPYPLLDFQPDTLLPTIRKEQFLRFQKELEKTRRKENTRLREFYVLRSIQYCADCEANQFSVAQVFPIDSLIRKKLKDNNITSEPQLGFFNLKENRYSYISPGSDSLGISADAFQFPFSEIEILKLDFPDKNRALWKSLIGTIASSLGLVLIAIICYGIATRMLIRQKKLNEMKNNFINNVTHEFKTPIATIAFALANIENENVLGNPKAIKQFTKVIKDENKRLNHQVEKVLQAALLDKKGLELEQEQVDIHQLIRDLAVSYSLQLAPKDNLTSLLHAKKHVVQGDPFHLSNAISNLLDNAIKYSSEPRKISIETQDFKQSMQIIVKDNGLGISAEAQRLIFEKFYRVPTGDIHTTKGFGLGLSYVKTIVSSHHGELTVQSRLGHGSTFTISLPIDR